MIVGRTHTYQKQKLERSYRISLAVLLRDSCRVEGVQSTLSRDANIWYVMSETRRTRGDLRQKSRNTHIAL